MKNQKNKNIFSQEKDLAIKCVAYAIRNSFIRNHFIEQTSTCDKRLFFMFNITRYFPQKNISPHNQTKSLIQQQTLYKFQ